MATTATERKSAGLFYGECVYCTSTNCTNCVRRQFASGEICKSDMDIMLMSDRDPYFETSHGKRYMGISLA